MKITKTVNKNSLLLFAIFLLSILPFSMNGYYHDSQRIITAILISFLILVQLSINRKWSRLELSSLVYLVSWGLISSINSTLPIWSLLEVSSYSTVSILIIIIFKNINKDTIEKLAFIFIVAQSIYAARDLINYLLIITNDSSLYLNYIIDGFSNRRFYAQFLSWTLPFIIGFLAIKTSKKYQRITIAITSISWTLVLMSGTRAFILGIAFSLIATLWITPHIWARYAKWTFLTGLVGALGYMILVSFLPDLLGIDNDNIQNHTINRNFSSSSGRIDIWINTFNIALNHPITGIGPMMTAAENILNKVAHPHNFPLQLAAEWGFPFSLTFMIFISYIILKWKSLIAEAPDKRESLALPITAATSSAIAVSLVDGIMVMPVSLFYMSLILGAGAALLRSWTPHVKRMKIPVWGSLLLIAPVLFMATITIDQWINLNSSTQENDDISKADNLDLPSPRYWADGKLSTK